VRLAFTLLAWLLVLPFVAWAAIRLSGSERGFPVVALIAYTPYVAAAAAVIALALVAVRRRLPALIAALAAAALGSGLVDRAVPDSEASVDGARLRVLTANVAFSEVEADVLARMVREHRVDVLSLQELTPELAARLRSGRAGRLLPHAAMRAGTGASGTGLMSRRPLTPRPAPPALKNRTAVARVRWPGFGSFEVVAVHPPPPTPGQVGRWGPDLRALPPAVEGGLPRVLAGDFNATLDHAEFRLLLARGYRDAAASAGSGLKGTWPSSRRLPPVAIDHVLVPAAWRVVSVRVLDLPGSDHRAVLAELAPPPSS
jgi:endonuclease/exonuclease/phosphatase (EEP) superfamily protein YafD